MSENNLHYRDGKYWYDLYLNDRWIGMSKGNTPEDARASLSQSWPDTPDIIMIPFYQFRQSDKTYEILTGRKARTQMG